MSSLRWWRSPAIAAGILTLAAATLSACGNGSATPAAQLGVHVPEGWTTHTYDGVAISTPADWAYAGPGTKLLCGLDPQNGGSLAIDVTESGAGCPYDGHPSGTSIWIQSVGFGSGSPPPTYWIRVNGLNVKVVENAGINTLWFVPSLNLTVSGSGPEADKVLHTLRPT